MAKVHEAITAEIAEFIGRQQMFFVGTAPLDGEGHVNLSPKGLDCFRILSPQRVGYMDVIGSGNETAAHLLENGRITFMFCAFEGAPTFCACTVRGMRCCRDRRRVKSWRRPLRSIPARARSSWRTSHACSDIVWVWRARVPLCRPTRVPLQVGERSQPRGIGTLSAEKQRSQHRRPADPPWRANERLMQAVPPPGGDKVGRGKRPVSRREGTRSSGKSFANAADGLLGPCAYSPLRAAEVRARSRRRWCCCRGPF